MRIRMTWYVVASAVLPTLWTIAALGENEQVRRIPPVGIAVSDADRDELQGGIAQLGKQIDALKEQYKSDSAMLDLIPDVQIFHNAARYALEYNEFFKPDEIGNAKALLKQGMDRATALRDRQAPWTKSAGLVVRGYVSKIDGSVQPYGLVVPASAAMDPQRPRRLDIWFHGRGETLSEVNFLSERQRSAGEFTPADTIVLHPYGRYCNANRFAGEIDTFEALDAVKKHYAIDEDRVLVRGFSMGGAACWMFATHHAGLWAAAAPGAGFSKTAGFLHIADLNAVPWYQRTLWHLYDSTDYALNLFDCPTVAYSGGIDPQKQAADKMAQALADVGIELVHVIGPNTPHRYHPQAKEEINRRIDSIARHGRNPIPWHVKFTTWTLRYNRMLWLQLDGLEHHWQQAVVDAKITHPLDVEITTKNVTALTITMPPGYCPLEINHDPRVLIDGHQLTAPKPLSDRSWMVHLRRFSGVWQVAASSDDGTLQKRHGLQGPIDDAFMDSFIMVRPTGKPINEQTGRWVHGEMAHAIEHWRRQFRGEARVKDDAAIDENDIASSNLVLWGDPSSNAILAKISDKLPIRWDAQSIRVGQKTFPSATHVPVLIYPNPLNPKRYAVLNSGFTFREADYLSNARQTPKLPDWAVINTTIAPSAHAPGGVADAGFFGERWEPMDVRP